jgi:hypothetical protein
MGFASHTSDPPNAPLKGASGRRAGCRRRVALAFDLGNLLLHHGKPLDFPRDQPWM